VKPPRIKEAYGWIECGYKFDIEAGDHHIVVGEVIYAEIKEESFITPKGNLNLAELKPLLHLGGDEFAFPTTL
jgi:flavin reductase (DIM6/NTAB) family NADH-FMN oxidoreductase RutF